MTQHEHNATGERPLSECPPEIQAVVRNEYQNDPTRLQVGDHLKAYVEADNSTETWEVVAQGTTITQILVRLINTEV